MMTPVHITPRHRHRRPRHMTTRKKKTTRKPSSKPARVGRPRLERADWSPETYKLLAQMAGFSPAQMAQEIGVSTHLVYCWQSARVERKPTVDQAAAVAQLLTDKLGRRIKPKDLARDADNMKVVFGR